MIKYRPHKGLLSESINEEKEFDTIDQMYDFILTRREQFIPPLL